jgi:predicted lysophospholipase L1 biosynthesis ABC-type transport system permease subunit
VKGFKDTSAGLKLVHTDINITIPEKVAKYVRLVDGQWQTRKTVRSKWREVSAEEATVILQQV